MKTMWGFFCFSFFIKLWRILPALGKRKKIARKGSFIPSTVVLDSNYAHLCNLSPSIPVWRVCQFIVVKSIRNGFILYCQFGTTMLQKNLTGHRMHVTCPQIYQMDRQILPMMISSEVKCAVLVTNKLLYIIISQLMKLFCDSETASIHDRLDIIPLLGRSLTFFSP